MVWTDSPAVGGQVSSAGAGGVWPKKPGSRKDAGDTLEDVLNPLQPVPINITAASASKQPGFQFICTTAS
jgi:hypothetical protein